MHFRSVIAAVLVAAPVSAVPFDIPNSWTVDSQEAKLSGTQNLAQFSRGVFGPRITISKYDYEGKATGLKLEASDKISAYNFRSWPAGETADRQDWRLVGGDDQKIFAINTNQNINTEDVLEFVVQSKTGRARYSNHCKKRLRDPSKCYEFSFSI